MLVLLAPEDDPPPSSSSGILHAARSATLGAQPTLQSCGMVNEDPAFCVPKVQVHVPIVAPALQSHEIARFSAPPAHEYCSWYVHAPPEELEPPLPTLVQSFGVPGEGGVLGGSSGGDGGTDPGSWGGEEEPLLPLAPPPLLALELVLPLLLPGCSIAPPQATTAMTPSPTPTPATSHVPRMTRAYQQARAALVSMA